MSQRQVVRKHPTLFRMKQYYIYKGGFKWLFNLLAWLFVAFAVIIVLGLVLALR
jgi:hypothetical protein